MAKKAPYAVFLEKNISLMTFYPNGHPTWNLKRSQHVHDSLSNGMQKYLEKMFGSYLPTAGRTLSHMCQIYTAQ